MPRYLLLIAGIAIALCSCSKKNYQATTIQSPVLSLAEKTLSSYIWKESTIIAHKLVGQDTIAYNITKQFANTDKDDLTIFREDGTFLFEEGHTKYTPQSSQQYYTGLWQLSADQQYLTLSTDKSADRYQVIQLNSSRIVLKLSVNDQESTYYYLLTYTAVDKTASGRRRELLTEQAIYTEVDKQPEYPGGFNELFYFISKRQQYPAVARKNKVEGRVVVQFIISPEGVPGQFEIIESLGYGCDEAVLQTCKAMNRWQPGLLNNKTVSVQVTLPVIFKL